MFGATSSPSTTEYCYLQTAEVFAADDMDVRRAILEDTYVDDILTGADDDAAATTLIWNLIRVLRCGGFELAPFASNSQSVLKAISAQEPLRTDVRLDPGVDDTSSTHRALGILWKTASDVLTFQMKLPSSTPTKRTVLSHAMTVFDPFGFLSGWLLQPRILMQQLWRRGLEWDDEVPSDLLPLWKSSVDEHNGLQHLSIPRYAFGHGAEIRPDTQIDLHIFCDASEDGFAAVCYHRWADTSGAIQVNLAYARAHLAPVKRLTIPRLELQAAVLGTRVAEFVKKETRRLVGKCALWTDSQNVLAWIKSTDQRFQTFVSNRLGEIHDASSPTDWRYVPSQMNPVDQASRGQKMSQLAEGSDWRNGPGFLADGRHMWPRSNDASHKLIMSATPSASEVDLQEAMPDNQRFSRWTVALRTVALIRRVRNWKRGPISAEELEAAEGLWMKLVQASEYPEELKRLKANFPVSNRSSLRSLNPALTNGLIRVDSRICRTPHLSERTIFPPTLPRGHQYTHLLFQHLHERMAHRAHEAVLVELRLRSWVPHARRTIRTVVSRCQRCKVLQVVPQSARMALLPLALVRMLGGAFLVCGLDYFGPLLTTQRGEHGKALGCRLSLSRHTSCALGPR